MAVGSIVIVVILIVQCTGRTIWNNTYLIRVFCCTQCEMYTSYTLYTFVMIAVSERMTPPRSDAVTGVFCYVVILFKW